jgi:hypothetical protein
VEPEGRAGTQVIAEHDVDGLPDAFDQRSWGSPIQVGDGPYAIAITP